MARTGHAHPLAGNPTPPTAPVSDSLSLAEAIKARPARWGLNAVTRTEVMCVDKSYMNTKRVCISWDVREHSQSAGPVTLSGKRHRNKREAISIGKHAFPTLEDTDTAPYCFYHLRDEQRFVGERGFATDSRWVGASRRLFRFFLWQNSSTEWEYVHSYALVGDMRAGLNGIEARVFDEEQEGMKRTINNRLSETIIRGTESSEVVF
jgi:hypothetical protein